MPAPCDFIVSWDATPDELRALGTGLWRWCTHSVPSTGISRYVDNQSLADLLNGALPESGEGDERGVHLYFADEGSESLPAAMARLRREIPATGIVDVTFRGVSWQECDLESIAPNAAPRD